MHPPETRSIKGPLGVGVLVGIHGRVSLLDRDYLKTVAPVHPPVCEVDVHRAYGQINQAKT